MVYLRGLILSFGSFLRRAEFSTIRLPPDRARVLSQDRRVSSSASDRSPARGLGGEPVDRQEPHRGVQRRQRVLHRVAEGIPVRHAVAGSGARGHGGCDGGGLPPVWGRAEPGADRDVRRRGLPAGPDEPPDHGRRLFRGLPARRLTQPHGVEVRRKKRVAFSHMSFCFAGSLSCWRQAITASARYGKIYSGAGKYV